MENTFTSVKCGPVDEDDHTFKVKFKQKQQQQQQQQQPKLHPEEKSRGKISVKTTSPPPNYLHPHHQEQQTRQEKRQENLLLFPPQLATHFWNRFLPLSEFSIIQIEETINKCNQLHSLTHVNNYFYPSGHISTWENKSYSVTTSSTTKATATASTSTKNLTRKKTSATRGTGRVSKMLPVTSVQIVNKLLPLILLTSLFVNNILIVNSASTHTLSQMSKSSYTLKTNPQEATTATATQLTNHTTSSDDDRTVTIKFTTSDGPTTKSTGIYDHSTYFPFASSTVDRLRRSNPSATNSNSLFIVNTSPVTVESTTSSSTSSISWTDILHSTNSLHDASKYKNGGLTSSAYLTPLPLSDSNHHTSPTESTIDLNYQRATSNNSTSGNLRSATFGGKVSASRRPNYQKFLTHQLKRFIDCREKLIASYKFELDVSVDPFAGNLTDEESLLSVSSTANQVNYPSPNSCEGSFDGFNCWLPTEAGSSLTLDCPQEFYTSMTAVEREKGRGIKVTRTCFANGSWDEDVNGYYKKECNFDPSIINGDPNDMELLQRLILDVSKLDSSPFADVRTTMAFEECIDSVLAKPLPADKGKLQAPLHSDQMFILHRLF